MFNQSKIAAVALAASCLAAASASAAPVWPSSIVGTWSGLSNLSQIVMTVTSQTSGGSRCQSISGTIEDVATSAVGNMLGYYCPNSGAVEFMRYPTNSNVAFQVYTANLSQTDAPKSVGGVFIAGTFSQYSLLYGPLGQYSTSLSKYSSVLTK